MMSKGKNGEGVTGKENEFTWIIFGFLISKLEEFSA